MKATNLFFLFVALCLSLFGCSSEEEQYFDQNFVRFSLRVTTTNELDYIKANARETEEYTHSVLNSLKIPVLRSAVDIGKELEIDFSTTISGNFRGIEVSPKDKVTIAAGKVSDTITVSFKGIWKESDLASITLKMNALSDPNVSIGWPRSSKKMDQLNIKLGSPKPVTFTFEKNLYEVNGSMSGAVQIPIVFSQILSKQLLEQIEVLKVTTEALSSCQFGGTLAKFSIVKIPPLDQGNKLVYLLQFSEPLDQNTKLVLTLDTIGTGFTNGSITQTTVIKSSIQLSTDDPAKNWYDVADGFYRTYGKAWYKDPITGECRWSTFNTFTKPVVVPSGHPNANSSAFHRFRIAFLGNNLPIGTNPFDFRRFYSGASVESPAYNIEQAIEFIPDGNTGSGIVRIIPQTLLFLKTSKFPVLKIPVCGSGTYSYDSNKKRWQMFIAVVSDETELGGPSTVSRYMYIYNNNIDATNPTDLTVPCVLRYDL